MTIFQSRVKLISISSAALIAASTSSFAQYASSRYQLDVLYRDPKIGLICAGPLGPGPCAAVLEYLAGHSPPSVLPPLPPVASNPGQLLGGPNSEFNNPSQIWGGGSHSLVEEHPWGFCAPPCLKK